MKLLRYWIALWRWWRSCPGPIVVAGRYQSQPSRMAFLRWLESHPRSEGE